MVSTIFSLSIHLNLLSIFFMLYYLLYIILKFFWYLIWKVWFSSVYVLSIFQAVSLMVPCLLCNIFKFAVISLTPSSIFWSLFKSVLQIYFFLTFISFTSCNGFTSGGGISKIDRIWNYFKMKKDFDETGIICKNIFCSFIWKKKKKTPKKHIHDLIQL